MAKPTRQSVIDFGLPAPAAAQPPLLVERVDTSAGLLFYRAHGLALDAAISLRRISDTTLGAQPTALPGGLAEGVTYYARPATADSFALATAVSPAAALASFSSPEVGRFSFLWDPWTAFDIAIDRAWRAIMAMCTAHGGDIEAGIVTDAAASLAVQFYVAHMAASDPAKADSYKPIADLYESTYKPLLAAYFAGVPVRGARDATPDVSEGSPRFKVLGPSAPSGTSWGTCSEGLV